MKRDLEKGKRSEAREEALEGRLENSLHHELFIHQQSAGGRDGRALQSPVFACAIVLESAESAKPNRSRRGVKQGSRV